MAKDVKNQDDLDDRIGPAEPIEFYLTSPASFTFNKNCTATTQCGCRTNMDNCIVALFLWLLQFH